MSENMELTILATSDVHGYFFPTNFTSRNQNQPFGLLKAASLIRRLKEESRGPVVTIDNGDFIQGSPLTYVVAKSQDEEQYKRLMSAQDLVGYDVGVIGNHEFNYGRHYLQAITKYAEHPILAANILDQQTGESLFQPYVILEKEGVKIAVLGLTTSYIPHWEHPENIADLIFEDIVETAQKYVPKLREQADVVIVSYHGGFERDLESGQPTEALTGENEGYRLLQEVAGIDALVTGHQHRELAAIVNGVPIVQPGFKGECVGKIRLDLERKGDGTYQVQGSQAALERVAEQPLEESVREEIQPLQEQVEDWLDQVIGRTNGSLVITNPNEVRLKEHPYIEFIQRVQMKATGAPISGTALFNNDGRGLNEEITMRDIVTNYIYPNTLAVLKLSGKDLRAALEQCAEFFCLEEDGSIGVSERFIRPKPQFYNYDMYEGIDYTIDVSKPIGERIVELTFDGKDVQDDDELEVVMNQYRAVGGGNFAMFDASKIIREVQIDMTELIADYLAKHPVIDSTVNDNFKVVVS